MIEFIVGSLVMAGVVIWAVLSVAGVLLLIAEMIDGLKY